MHNDGDGTDAQPEDGVLAGDSPAVTPPLPLPPSDNFMLPETVSRTPVDITALFKEAGGPDAIRKVRRVQVEQKPIN